MTGADSRPKLEVSPLTRETLQERVYRNIVELILDGSIVPGETVTLHSLSEAFGVSPMPVREALHRLTAANALTVVSGRSIGIPKLTHERLLDLRNVRNEVEGLAAIWAADRRTQKDIEAAGRHLAQLETTNESGDVRAYLRANYAFHFSIYQAAGSPNLLKIIEDLWLQNGPYFNLLHGSGNYTRANAQHRLMYEALVIGDAEKLRSALHGDMDAAFQVVQRLLPHS